MADRCFIGFRNATIMGWSRVVVPRRIGNDRHVRPTYVEWLKDERRRGRYEIQVLNKVGDLPMYNGRDEDKFLHFFIEDSNVAFEFKMQFG